MRTEQLLASGARIREERALKMAARTRPADATVADGTVVECPPERARVEKPATSGSTRSRAA
jgi:hypothetical protein